MSESRVRYGWGSSFTEFSDSDPKLIRERLQAFVADASREQVRAWDEAIRPLQTEVSEVLLRDAIASQYSAILEYELPMESRRPDVLLLVGAGVLVVELKGKLTPSQADLDQVSAYARDLRNYHRACADRPVVPVLVPTRATGYQQEFDGVHVVGPDALDDVVMRFVEESPEPVILREAFLADDAYAPLPSLVEAARELFRTGSLRTIRRARAATDPCLDVISRVAHQAAITKSRHLILVTGVPGAGKTLVGLQAVHARYLDDLAVARDSGKPTAPGVFLSGNGPLVDVLQYELKQAGGDGKTFVRGVKDYVKRYSGKRSLVPPEHVMVFDEAQRAFDSAWMREKHGEHVRSEPEEFIGFADRIPEWCVVIGLIGTGQEIHIGEEGGLGQWREAVLGSDKAAAWTVHGPPAVRGHFDDPRIVWSPASPLSLDVELRFHQARELHRFVGGLLATEHPESLRAVAQRLERDGFHLRITRSLPVARDYLRERYADDRDARFGLVASSKDKSLTDFGVPNDYVATKKVKMGPWYGDEEDDYRGRSCRRLESCVTEFGAQGLELDAALLAWGTDLVMERGAWNNARAAGYQKRQFIKDAMQLRLNAYRVLLTRGRDGIVVFVPPMPVLDETFTYLTSSGFRRL
jgi:hypothetical protein